MGRFTGEVGALMTFCVKVAVISFSPLKVVEMLDLFDFGHGCNGVIAMPKAVTLYVCNGVFLACR
jgi:hypothetical protein